ncbi:hypothetical protein CVD28_21615 [Bacillus sp. M6-12]|nr:hypothetical protein CVD28_21615 [Bacillus sp. M6-12]
MFVQENNFLQRSKANRFLCKHLYYRINPRFSSNYFSFHGINMLFHVNSIRRDTAIIFFIGKELIGFASIKSFQWKKGSIKKPLNFPAAYDDIIYFLH